VSARSLWLLPLLLLAAACGVVAPIALGAAAGFAHSIITAKPPNPVVYKEITVTRAASAAVPKESLVCE